ncbi:RNA-directed DNA polymerase, eukaryota [Tanacetum coccineum]
MVRKQIEEDKVRQLAIMNLSVEFENASIAKDDLRKTYDECSDIPQRKRALIDTFLKQESDKDYEIYNALFRKLWNAIEGVIKSFDAIWIIFGDFNVVGSHDERIGSSFDDRDVNSFDEFVTRDATVTVLCRSWYDHCPISLKAGLLNSGPKPYRIFDKWIGDVDLKEVIPKSWAYSFFSTPDVNLKNKLKKLRLDIKAWTTNRICVQNKIKDDLIQLSGEWDVKAENALINEMDVVKREE